MIYKSKFTNFCQYIQDFSLFSNLESLIASDKVDIGVCKNVLEKIHNVSFIYKFYFITNIYKYDIAN